MPDLLAVSVTAESPASTGFPGPCAPLRDWLTQPAPLAPGWSLWTRDATLAATWRADAGRWAIDWAAIAEAAASAEAASGSGGGRAGTDRRADRIALACARGRPLAMGDVMTWSDTLLSEPVPRLEYSTYTHGRVRPESGTGRWLADVGIGGTTTTLGAHGSPAEAENAIRAVVTRRRNELRDALRKTGQPQLALVAAAPWQEPDVEIWATQTAIERACPWRLADLARACQVPPAVAQQWLNRDILPPYDLDDRWYPDTLIAWCQANDQPCNPAITPIGVFDTREMAKKRY